MIEVRESAEFSIWLDRLGASDRKARTIVAARILRVEAGNFGDVRSVGDKVSELRIDYGPGYRAYFTQVGRVVVFMLCGGDKATQAKDIAKAKRMAAELHR
ncbi:MAG: type II toxin-antitoxin system RelE/ParE family toxin [Phenylobacterium sp.]|nr:type II toxin-antitoxin system RelE/ParE family toxin [Phenylobacterium sp.]